MGTKYLYVVFSATPYKMGHSIRLLTGERYNHVSIALNDSLEPMYSFARRYFRTPFYGGFVKESLSRYCVNGELSQICVCRLEISRDRYTLVAQRLAEMTEHQQQYLYNYLSAIMAPLHKTVKVRDSYLCVEFVIDILKYAGFEIRADRYYTVGELEQLLHPYVVYTGTIPKAKEYDTTYFAMQPLPYPMLMSLRSFFALFRRLQL